MAGSWELINQNRCLTVILTREIVTTTWALGFKNLQIPGTWCTLSGMPFDHARNTGCQKLLELDWEWLFFLDDDIVCPPDTIQRLIRHDVPIVSGLYYRRNPPLVPVMLRAGMKDGVKGYNWVTEYQMDSLIEVDLVGAGCLLIRRDVIQTLQPMSNRCRWFEWRCDRTDLPDVEKTSEDFSFCTHAQKAGYKIMVDTSIGCRHIGHAESRTDGKFIPLEQKA